MPIRSSWRILKRNFSTTLNGEGAKRGGGRWNSVGTPIAYTAGSLALTTLEILAHIPGYELLQLYKYIEIRFNDKHLQRIAEPLPLGWDADPPGAPSMTIGDLWAFNCESLVLEVPSSIIHGENNYLINPKHPDLKELFIGPPIDYPYDKRLETK